MGGRGVGLVLVVGLAACGGRGEPSERVPRAPSTAERRLSEGDARGTSRGSGVDADPRSPPLLSPEVISLGGGVLLARLPWGVVSAHPSSPDGPGLLVMSTHRVRLTEHDVFVSVTDAGERAGADFEPRAADAEKVARCAAPTTEVEAAPDVPAPAGFDVVVFRPDEACSTEQPPDLRLWVREPDGTVVRVELVCADEPCRWDSPALLEAFVGSFEPGAPTPAPAGERRIGSNPDFAIHAEVPEGFLVAQSEGEDYVVYEVFRRRTMGAPWEGLVVSYLYSQSPNSLQQDYRPRDARTRMVPGTIGGRRTRFLEIVKEGRTRLVGRISMATVQLDFELTGTTPESMRELRAIVEGLELPEDLE